MTAPVVVQPGDRWGAWVIEQRADHPRLRVRRPKSGEAPFICSLSAACDMAHRIAPVVHAFADMGQLERTAILEAAQTAAVTWDAGRQAVAA